MFVFGPRAQSRSTTLLLVAAVHGLIFWGIWRVRAPVAHEVETFASVMFFVPKAASQHSLAATTPGAVLASRASRARRSLPSPPPQPQPDESATAITLSKNTTASGSGASLTFGGVADLLSNPTSLTGTLTGGSTSVTGLSSTVGMYVGQSVAGTGITARER